VRGVSPVWGPFVSLHAEDTFGLSKPQINNLFAVGGFACMVASILGGHSASRFGGRNLLIAAGLGHVVRMVFWALAGTSPLGLALFVITNMGLQIAIIIALLVGVVMAVFLQKVATSHRSPKVSDVR